MHNQNLDILTDEALQKFCDALESAGTICQKCREVLRLHNLAEHAKPENLIVGVDKMFHSDAITLHSTCLVRIILQYHSAYFYQV